MLFKKVPEKYALSADLSANNDLSVAEPGDTTWWMPDIKRKELKQLMQRQDRRPLANYLLWLALLVGTGVLAFMTLGTWWAVPAFLIYGTIYSSSDPRSHDLGHGATFKSRWLNSIFCNLCLFMTLKEPIDWRWRHTRHHTDTIHVGLDPEILVTRPADLLRVAADFFFLMQAKGELKSIITHAFGVVSHDALHYVPKSEWRKMFWSSRFYLACIVGVIAWCIAAGTIVPLLFIWGPRFYANWLNYFGFLSQHAGLAEDSHDHRLNTRTFTMNPAFEFLYANLNYHIEHHVYPSIPYYNLPVLHRMIRDELPYTYTGLIDVSREVLPVLWRQAHDAGYFTTRELPPAKAARGQPAFTNAAAPAQ
ncbi:fatty acid desaturase [Mesorhizobium amorphae]|uniref:fatty acid desaturase n=1 Tax=Mesorhizobium amorphae TaxID=71433 RepID=UPI00235C8184|nr:fatty acid desaturase [Mesorhizobium amorphae]GLR46109.1 fatty acid desaturase [Mesorhizobium amorphae]